MIKPQSLHRFAEHVVLFVGLLQLWYQQYTSHNKNTEWQNHDTFDPTGNKDHIALFSWCLNFFAWRMRPCFQFQVLCVVSLLCPLWTKAANLVCIKHPLRVVTLTLMLAQSLASAGPTPSLLQRGESKSSSIFCICRAAWSAEMTGHDGQEQR